VVLELVLVLMLSLIAFVLSFGNGWLVMTDINYRIFCSFHLLLLMRGRTSGPRTTAACFQLLAVASRSLHSVIKAAQDNSYFLTDSTIRLFKSLVSTTPHYWRANYLL
jgi:hypothetical protein